MVAVFRLVDTPIDTTSLRQQLRCHQAGAFASFEGWVRANNAGRPVAALTYEAYAALAGAEGTRLLDEARSRFAIVDALCVHRTGTLQLGEMAVWVGVTAAHRDAAFAACRWIIDAVKAQVPIWKHEHYADGLAEWLHPVEGGGSADG